MGHLSSVSGGSLTASYYTANKPEAHGGRIHARANADQGLTGFVELPAES